MSMLILAGEATSTHAVVQSDWIDWTVMVVIAPLLALLYQYKNSRGYGHPEPKEAALHALPPLGLAGLMLAFIYLKHGPVAGSEFFAGFAVEFTLSFDNVFAWFGLVSAFIIWKKYHKPLVFWGVFIAIILRVVLLSAGAGLIAKLWWLSIILGLMLAKIGWNFLVECFAKEDEDKDVTDNKVFRFLTTHLPVSRARYGTSLITYEESAGFISVFGVKTKIRKFKLTPFGIAVVCLGGVDLLFAGDSIPAILAIAHDPFIILSSNILAVLFLQSLYFLYSALEEYLVGVKYALPLIMGFVAAKILLGSEALVKMQENTDLAYVGSVVIALAGVGVAALGGYIPGLKARLGKAWTNLILVTLAGGIVAWIGANLGLWTLHIIEISPVLSVELIMGLLIFSGLIGWLVQRALAARKANQALLASA